VDVMVIVGGSPRDQAALKVARRLLGSEGTAHLLYVGDPGRLSQSDRVGDGARRGTAVNGMPEWLQPTCGPRGSGASSPYDRAMIYLSRLLPELHLARVNREVALGSDGSAEAVSYARRHAVEVAVVSANGEERALDGVAEALLESGVAPVLSVPCELLEQVTREEAERLIAQHQLEELERTSGAIVCELYGRQGQGPCAGLDRFSDDELKSIYASVVEDVQSLDSATLRRVVARFEQACVDPQRPTTCEVMREERRLCTGLGQFSNAELERAFPRVFAHRVIVG
jgi:hypothetical protein